MGKLEKIIWVEKTDGLGRTKKECYYKYYGKDKLIGSVSYHPENFDPDKKWEAHTPGPHFWETRYFPSEEDAMKYVTRKIKQESYSSPYTVKPELDRDDDDNLSIDF